MSHAIYHHGLTIEYDLEESALLIEGQYIPIQSAGGQYQSENFPNLKADTKVDLAKQIIEQDPVFKLRESVREEHIAILKKGIVSWNAWRSEYPHIRPTLYGLIFREAGIGPDLTEVNFSNADLRSAQLDGMTLTKANFHEANLGMATLKGVDLQQANFCRTDLYCANLSNANLTGANLQGTQLARTVFAGAKLIGCTIYGLSAWDLDLEGPSSRT